jgi:hypothetical protein
MLVPGYLLQHLFDDEQIKSTEEKFISGFFVEIEITNISVERHFPLINNGEGYFNKLCNMYVDHITLQYLINFRKIEYRVIPGYYYKENRDLSLRDVVRGLFELRLKYKSEGNPTQEIIKLLLNSINGRTILKPIETNVKLINKEASNKYIFRNYNSIEEYEEVYDSKFIKIDELKNLNKHYNLVHLGCNILSMSKRIVNEVMCLAEDNGIEMYYQDTDSLRLPYDKIGLLTQLFKEKYGRELIENRFGQFQSDYPEISNGFETYGIKGWYCGKKAYMARVSNDNGDIAFLSRLKAIKPDVIEITAKQIISKTYSCRIKKMDSTFLSTKNIKINAT